MALGQTELGDTVDQHAAGQVERLKDGDVVALLAQVARAGEAAGPEPTIATLWPLGCGLDGLTSLFVVPVGDKALEAADADGLALDAAHALALALLLLRADTAADGGQGVLVDDLIAPSKSPSGDLGDEFGMRTLNGQPVRRDGSCS